MQPERNQAYIDGLAARLDVLYFGLKVVSHFSQIRADLYVRGTPIGSYDILIAGHVLAAGLILSEDNTQ